MTFGSARHEVEEEAVNATSVARSYPRAWRGLRRRRWAWLGSWLGGMPVTFLLGIPLSELFGSQWPVTVVWFAVAGVFATGLWMDATWRCPRCGEEFHWGDGGCNVFARRCGHCGLPKR